MDIEVTGKWEQLLLLAALRRDFGPDTNLERANCDKVVHLALYWGGLTEPEFDDWYDNSEVVDAEECHNSLIRMVGHSIDSNILFEGWGNYGSSHHVSSHPRFCSCRLTELGMHVARSIAKLRDDIRFDDLGWA